MILPEKLVGLNACSAAREFLSDTISPWRSRNRTLIS